MIEKTNLASNVDAMDTIIVNFTSPAARNPLLKGPEIGYTIDNTSKTRALFEINKGVHSGDSREGVNANTKIPEELRRVHFINMVYVTDGPSDIPAFSVVNKNGGATFAIYPKGDSRALRQVEQMRVEGRINMYAEADYSEWCTFRLPELCDRSCKRVCTVKYQRIWKNGNGRLWLIF